jgi:NADPH-dependent glutamate synthase beta subunit-like oxidoreductase
MMITLTIDHQTVTVAEGTTVLEAARSIGIRIPSLCFAEGFKPSTSCMVCVVRVDGIRSLVPACGLVVSEGMNVVTQSDEIQKARTAAVELLLSDHAGDCLGPCEIGCPAKMDIPAMLRQIVSGDLTGALATVKKDIPLPAILGRICPAPCEKVCRRTDADGAVPICALKRFVADTDLACAAPYQPAAGKTTDLKAAIIGAGPAGLSAAYYLQLAGVACAIFDDHPHPGGALRYAELDRSLLPLSVVDKEIETVLKIGIRFHGAMRFGRDITLSELSQKYDAVVLAVGAGAKAAEWSIPTKDGKISVNRHDYSVTDTIFAAGACIGSRNMAVRAVADGKEAAQAILRKLLTLENPPPRPYNHRLGRLEKPQLDRILARASTAQHREADAAKGFTTPQATEQAERCLHCDCGKRNHCTLRDLATEFNAAQKTWSGDRSAPQADEAGGLLAYDAAKCVKCGLCVQFARRNGQAGFAFEGRGFGMRITAPLNRTRIENLIESAEQYVRLCPTGALTLNRTVQQ